MRKIFPDIFPDIVFRATPKNKDFHLIKIIQIVMMQKWAFVFLLMSTLSGTTKAGTDSQSVRKSDRAPVGVFYSDVFLSHDTGEGHPERPDRLRAILEAIRQSSLHDQVVWPTFPSATPEQLQRVHPKSYIELVQREIESGRHQLSTGDTKISRETLKAARLAAGAGVAAADGVMEGKLSSAFCLVRPPGHHATADHGMGFCIFNNVAIVARHLQKRHGIQRVLIVDFDVHHGNGTQDIFYNDPTVFYFSVHQHGIYPGSGHSVETGHGKGNGFTLNVELKQGDGDPQALEAFQSQLKPAMERFRPEFILVSAGFDAHRDDPLAGLAYTEKGYAALAKELRTLADGYSGGKIVFLLEGGYGLKGLASSVVEVLKVLLEK